MILRICLVIPTYNNAESISQVVDEVLRTTTLPILIVDDGSDIPVETLLIHAGQLSAMKANRLQILRIEKNLGKGLALQKAISKTLELGFTHLLSFDGDGQHLASEILKLVEMGKKSPWSLIIGSRKLTSDHVPGVSKFGRAFSNFWVKFQTETPISDSQSGFRLYPLFHLQNLHFCCRRYDFEIEVLIRLLWKGVSILETEIDVFYPEKSLRVSHFHKLWDNVRISLLNTLLVVLSLLHSRVSPVKTGLAVGLGVFIGCTPFFGFHTLIVAAFSFLFRLNAVFLWLGSQISIPPIAPFIILTSLFIGHFIFPELNPIPLSSDLSLTQIIDFAALHFKPWLFGSMILGTALAIPFGFMAGFISYRLQNTQKNKSTWNGRTRGGKLGNAFLKFVLHSLGVRAGYFCLFFIVPYFYLFAPRGRRALNEYWQQIRPELSFFSRQLAIAKHFFRYGQVLMDTVFQNFPLGMSFQTNPHGIENILAAANLKQGLIMLSAHVGAWSLASSLLEKDGFKKDFYVVEYLARQDGFTQVRGPAKEDHLKKFSIAQESPSIFEIYESLQKGKTIGVMADRPLAHRFELVKFFGKLAPIDVTAFRVAAITQCPLLFSFGFKSKGMTYDFFAGPYKLYQFTPPIDPEVQCLLWAEEFAQELESRLKSYPDQWFNFYPFWSSVPAAPNGKRNSVERNYLLEELNRSASEKLA